MGVIQLSVVIPDDAGSVSAVTDVLGAAGIDILGFSMSDAGGRGVLRLVVDKTDEACALLEAEGFRVSSDEVICLDLPHHPGGLSGVLKSVSDAGVRVEYVYSLIGKYVVLNVADIRRAAGFLKGHPLRVVAHAEIVKD